MAVSILQETPVTTRDAVLPYTMVGLNMLAATAAVYSILSPRALFVAILLILAGLPYSVYFRQRQYNRIMLNLVVMAPLLILTWLVVRNLPGLQIDWGDFWTSIMTIDVADFMVGMLHILVVTAAGRAFLLVTPRDLVQTPIPSFSIFMLFTITPLGIRQEGFTPFTLICLYVLLATSLYIFSQNHSQLWFTMHVPLRVQHQLIRWMVLTSLILFPLIVGIGVAMQPFNMPNMAQGDHLSPPFRFRLPSFFGNRYGLSLERSVDMLGDGWPNGNQRIMTVTTDKPTNLLWRATTYTTYRDGAWYPPYRTVNPMQRYTDRESPLTTGTFPTSDPGINQALHEGLISFDPYNPHYCLVRQSFDIKVRAIDRRVPLYGAYQIYRLQAPQGQFGVISVDEDGGLTTWRTPGAHIAPYDVLSVVKPSPSAMRLQAAVSLPPSLSQSYLQMPTEGSFQQRIREKALAILAERELDATSDPLAIVRQFEAYLGKHYMYTLKPSRPKGNEDPILDFLFSQKQGYCNYFSGAMVMLCRSVGIPARFVVGFATGDQAEERDKQGHIIYHVSAKHAHSWVELFLPHYGWYTSDPTAGSAEVPNTLGTTWDLLTEMARIIKGRLVTWANAIKNYPYLRVSLRVGVATLLVVFAGLIYWRRERPPSFPRRELTADEARGIVVSAYRRMHRWMLRWGIRKPEGLTATEFSSQFHTLHPAMGETIGAITDIYLQAQYGGEAIADADARRATELLHRLWEQGKTERRRLHQLAADQQAE